jgi:predicted porin
MKKVITAVGLVAAFVGAVQAQSSVTVYGIIDAGYVGGNSRISSSDVGTNPTKKEIPLSRSSEKAHSSK